MKILFLTSKGFDTPNSINHLCETLLEDALKSGLEVHCISSHKTGQYADIPAELLQYPNFTYDIIQRKNVNKNNFIKRYFDEVRYAFQTRKIWKKQKHTYDAVLLQSNPNSVVNAVLLSCLKKPIILNLYDVFPGHAMSIGVIKNKLVYNVLRLIQKILYRMCTYVVAMSDDMKKQLLAEKVPEEKIVVINNWFDDEIFNTIPRTENKFFQKYQLDVDKFYVQFAGLLGYVFDYKMYVDVAEKLQNHPEIVFQLIGDGNQKQIILDEIERRGLTNIQYYPWQPLDIIAHIYSACDVGIIPLKPGVIGNGIPSKACQLMAARRTIINSVEKSDYTVLFDEYKMGVNVTNHDAQSVADEILRLYRDKSLRETIGENACQYAWKHYSRQKNTAKFINLIRASIQSE